MADVPSRSKVYRTSVTFDLHSAVHWLKSKLYNVHFAKKVYIVTLEC